MAQLWGGRFTKETDKLVYNFNASISFDQKFYAQDIRGSIAHVTMLQKQGILTKEEKESIIEGLKGIQADVENGTLEITDEYEDIHSFVETNLIDRIGDAGKKLHTGRSRNDQVALDMRLYTRDEIEALDTLLKELLEVLLKLMKEHIETYMPGFTHLQKAQPVTLAHHLGAYFEMFNQFLFGFSLISKTRLPPFSNSAAGNLNEFSSFPLSTADCIYLFFREAFLASMINSFPLPYR